MGEMRRELVFIGPINVGNIPLAGDYMKNQMFLKRFEEVFDSVISIDTINWKKRPWLLVKIIIILLLFRKASVIMSVNTGSASVRSKVDLPAPLGPSRQIISPLFSVAFKPEAITLLPPFT